MLEVLLAVLATAMVPSADESAGSDPSTYLQICDSGGWRSETCSVTCHRAFNYWVTTCNVSCRSGYYACCSCDSGCDCILDHDEMWPLPPDPTPQPDPDPDEGLTLD